MFHTELDQLLDYLDLQSIETGPPGYAVRVVSKSGVWSAGLTLFEAAMNLREVMLRAEASKGARTLIDLIQLPKEDDSKEG